ncbi:MAG: HAD family hydrolase [Candidatus Gastranaerophilaceae bacterium]
MENIQWLFFDLGSTLVDETECYNSRIDFAVNSKELNRDEFLSKVYESAKTSATAIKTACAFYNIKLPEWDKSLEKLYSDTNQVLEILSKKYKLGIIANQSLGTKQRLDNWDIGKYFDVVVASAEAGCAKPDLKIFNLALEQAGCKSNEAFMIGDRLDNDIVPAKQLGMKTIWVRQGFAKYQSVKNIEEQPDYTVETIGDVLDVLT